MRKQCPQCKSENIRICSRRRDFLFAAGCLVVILFFSLLFYEAGVEGDSLQIFVAFILSSSAVLFAFIMGIYFFVRGIRTRGKGYYCNYCKKKFETPLLSPIAKADYLSDIRRPTGVRKKEE